MEAYCRLSMNLGDIFKSFFGFPARERNLSPNHMFDDDNLHDHPENPNNIFIGRFPLFGPDRHVDGHEGFHGDDSFPDGQSRGNVFGFPVFDMFKQMEDVMKTMEKEFQHFGIEGSPHDRANPFSSAGSPDPDSLRDKMLKEPDSNQPPPRPPPPDSDQPPPRPPLPPIFGRVYGHSAGPYNGHDGGASIPREDSDLDDEMLKGNIEVIWGNDKDHPSDGKLPSYLEPYKRTEHSPPSTFKSVAVRTYRSADGRTEERRSIQDGRGNDQTTVRRSLGDQTHTKTIHTDHTGTMKVVEDSSNMDKSDKDVFERMWRTKDIPSKDTPRGAFYHNPQFFDPETKTIFTNLFGQSFPGFAGDSY